ncbi:PAS domain S-box protein [Phormidium sp. FACHB-1136]|uniref:PAS domain S-box protein n=1 Tax=Phormidium sp. FACHB-1136 TaxID=2692848 RepID=UPI0016863A41|nr:PAS domain S-box protein [Phormidium sp. FACHB-1136]MBD2428702.1 PAS domain S-box protein [Phormidium sp. FACHB-1136]
MPSPLHRFFAPGQRRGWPHVPLVWVLVVPFVVQLAGSVGVVAYLYHRSAQRDLEAVAQNLLDQATQRIRSDLDQQLQQQQQALTVTYEALQRNPAAKVDEGAMRQLLWRKMQFSPTLSSLYWATEQGMEVGYGRLMGEDAVAQAEQLVGLDLDIGTPYLVQRDPRQRSQRYFYLVDGQGQPRTMAHTTTVPVTELPWYRAAQSLQGQGWTPIFSTHTTSQLSLNALLPLRDGEGRFEGVLSTFFALSDLSEFLRQLEFSPTGQAFILERSGALVASSSVSLPYDRLANGDPVRLYAQVSEQPWLRAVTIELLQAHGSFHDIEQPHNHLRVKVDGEVIYAEVQPYQDAYGLDWLLVMVLPQSDVMANLQASQRNLLWLWGSTLLLATGLGWLTARVIVTRLRQLSKASQSLAQGSPDPIAEATAVAELAHLTDAFNQMAQTIQTSHADLAQSIADLQASKARFRKLFQADVVGLLVSDREGQILDANDYFLTLLGYDHQTLAEGKLHWEPLTPTAYRQQDDTKGAELRQQGWVSAYEKEFYHRDGQRVPVLIGGTMVSDDQAIYVAVDIQDRKRAEQALQESQTFLQHIADASPNILYLYDVQEQRNIYVSGAVQDILGYSVEEVMALGTDLFKTICPPDQLAQLNRDYRDIATLADGETRSSELCIQTASGERRWIFNRYTAFRRDGEGRLRCTLGSVQDITALKQTEMETQRLKERLEFILAASPAAIFTCGLDYTITFISQNIEGMVGYTPEEIIGWEGFWAQHIHPDDADRVMEELGEFFQQGHSVHEYRWKHRQGHYRWMMNELSLVCDHQGQVQEIVGYCIDIDDRKQAEAQLQQTNADLLRATRMKDEFLAAMSHELRTPLTAILGMTEALMEEVFGPITPEQTKALDTVDRSGSHLLQLINDILDVSKLESGQMTLALGDPIDVAKLCQSSLSFVQPQAQAKAIHLDIQCPASLSKVILDERRMRQVLINLLSNAVKFTPPGGQVTLAASTQPSATQAHLAYLCLAVKDTGIGIAPADQARVFDPFVQVDSALNRKYEGTGLGLGLVKQLVELHGGRLTLSSTPGKGSCFTVYLPYTDDPRSRPALYATNGEG